MQQRPLRTIMAMALMASSGRLPAAEKDAGFVSLFNGKDLDGWIIKGKAAGWQVKDGVIRSEGAKGGKALLTVKKYSDFILKVDWKVSKNGNSGVFLRTPREGYPWHLAYEVQISNEPRDDLHCNGALYGYAAVKPRPDESADKWHTFEIHCVGPLIKVVSDGVTVVDVDQRKLTAPNEKGCTDPKTKPPQGHIGLQDSHASAGSYIEFRNVRIKELK